MALNTTHEDELDAAAAVHARQSAQAQPATEETPNLPVAVPVRSTPPALGMDYLPDAGELMRLERLADMVSRAGMVPASYRSAVASDGRIVQDRRPNVLVAALMGRTFGWDLLTAMRNIHVIEGAATLKPEALLGLIRARGHLVRIIRGEDRATVHARRVDTGDEQTATFTFEDAYRAGLARRGDNGMPYARSQKGQRLPWEQYPVDMCQWRAVSIVARGLFSDIALGLSYTPEELGAIVDVEGEVVVESAAMPDPPAPEPERPAEPAKPRPQDLTPEQHRENARAHARRPQPEPPAQTRPTLEEALQAARERREQAAVARAAQDLPALRIAQGHVWDAVRAYLPQLTNDGAAHQVTTDLANMTGNEKITPSNADPEQLHALAEMYEHETDATIRAHYEESAK